MEDEKNGSIDFGAGGTNMRKCGIRLIFLVVFCLLFGGCKHKEETGDIQIYYLNTEGTTLATENYKWKSSEIPKQIEEVLEKLRKPEDTVQCTSAIPADVIVTDFILEENRLDIYFSQEYELLDKPAEVLLRAAVVESLTEIEAVYLVRFYVNGEPLKDSHGNAVGYMRKDDFVQNTGAALNSYQQEEVCLYYASPGGTGLVKKKISLRYNSYMTIEKAIVEQLIKGPESGGTFASIPAETKLLGVSVKDNICYVNLNEGFLAELPSVNPELRVYSLVNSVIEGGNCNQVQILINGAPNVALNDSLTFEKPFREDMKMVEE